MRAEFYWTTNEERYGSGPFDSREAAVADALAELGVGDAGRGFWTAQQSQPSVRQFSPDAESIIENIGMQAYDMAGKCAADWPGHFDREGEAEKKLQSALEDLVCGWLEDHDPPGFWIAVEVQDHEVPYP